MIAAVRAGERASGRHYGGAVSSQVSPRRPVSLRLRDRPAATAVLLAVQLVAVVAVIVWASGRPLTPDGGLQQFDALSLRESVPGLTAVSGRPTLYVATGDLADPACAEELRDFLDRRTDPTYPAVLLVPAGPVPSSLPADTEVRTENAVALVRAVALPGAAQGCRPGYALVDGAGDVRYRTYDPGYGAHATEPSVLLDTLQREPR